MFDTILPFVLSGATALMMYLLKQKDKRGWYVSLGNQVLWFWFAVSTASWGLLPLNVWLTYVAVKGIKEWQHPSSSSTTESLTKQSGASSQMKMFPTE